ncbi:unnamed protein product [Trichobilharzia szidati]|nr:unnamed protein product [Trichobilharzia szidati]
MARPEFGRTQDIPLMKKEELNSTSDNYDFSSLSTTTPSCDNHKATEGDEVPHSLTDMYSTSVMLKGSKCVNWTTALAPSAQRLETDCYELVSPKKVIVIPKRRGRSQSSSPNGKSCDRPLADSSNDPNKRIKPDSSPIVTSPNIFSDGAFDFTTCDQCSELRSKSLDSWIDHLGEYHPVPIHWPSSRAADLCQTEKRYPYTTVVGSNKKRKATAIPRPLNSFMIFAQYLRRLILHWFPNAPNVHISQRVGQLWKQLDTKMRNKYIDEASRLQRLHAIEFPAYKYRPRKRTRSGNSIVINNNNNNNNNKNDELISKSNVISAKSKSRRLNNDENSNCNLKNSLHQDYDENRNCHHAQSPVQKPEKVTVNPVVCNRDYSQSCLQLNNRLNIELKQPVEVGCINNQYDTRGFLSSNLKDNFIFKENKEVDETMTLLVSGGGNTEHGRTYRLHKIIPCRSVDRISESYISPTPVNPGSQIKEIRIVNMQSQTVQQLLNRQPILCHTIVYEPLKATIVRPTVVPIKTDTAISNNLLLDTNVNNLNFRPVTTQSTITTTSLSPNSSSTVEFDYNMPHSNSTSEVDFENIDSQFTGLANVNNNNNTNTANYSGERLTTKQPGLSSYGSINQEVVISDGNISSKKIFIVKSNTGLCGFDEVDGKSFTPESHCQRNIGSFSGSTKFKRENDDVDTTLSFNDIDTYKSGASLDDLEEITLFPCEAASDGFQATDVPTDFSENPSSFSKLNNISNYEQVPSPLYTDTTTCTNTLTQINSLPSIESWTFGTSKSF